MHQSEVEGPAEALLYRVAEPKREKKPDVRRSAPALQEVRGERARTRISSGREDKWTRRDAHWLDVASTASQRLGDATKVEARGDGGLVLRCEVGRSQRQYVTLSAPLARRAGSTSMRENNIETHLVLGRGAP